MTTHYVFQVQPQSSYLSSHLNSIITHDGHNLTFTAVRISNLAYASLFMNLSFPKRPRNLLSIWASIRFWKCFLVYGEICSRYVQIQGTTLRLLYFAVLWFIGSARWKGNYSFARKGTALWWDYHNIHQIIHVVWLPQITDKLPIYSLVYVTAI